MPESLTVIASNSAELTTVDRRRGDDHQAPAAGAGKQSLVLRILEAAGSLAPLVGWPASRGAR
jgi:hypothetical protein